MTRRVRSLRTFEPKYRNFFILLSMENFMKTPKKCAKCAATLVSEGGSQQETIITASRLSCGAGKGDSCERIHRQFECGIERCC
jgi:hypothetical protein